MDPFYRKLLGVFLLLVAAISFVIPFSSGWVFLFIALALLGNHHAQTMVDKLRPKVKPWFGERIGGWMQRAMPEGRKPESCPIHCKGKHGKTGKVQKNR